MAALFSFSRRVAKFPLPGGTRGRERNQLDRTYSYSTSKRSRFEQGLKISEASSICYVFHYWRCWQEAAGRMATPLGGIDTIFGIGLNSAIRDHVVAIDQGRQVVCVVGNRVKSDTKANRRLCCSYCSSFQRLQWRALHLLTNRRN